MKAFYEHIDSIEKQLFVFRNINLTFFDAPFHYHPEFELTYIIEGEGIRYVGMKMEEFRAGELVLLGSNLPHCWLNRPQPDGSNVAANVIQFSPKIFESSFFQLLEFEDLKQLFLLAQEGLVFDGHILEPRLQALFEQPPAKRILSL
ncbi:MAG: cupin domain-containing protein [Spirosomataceae bacterium]